MAVESWTVIRSSEFIEWFDAKLTNEEQDAVVAATMRLQADGPALRRPLSGQIKTSKFPNMKELLPPVGNVRILYIFDPARRAVFLLGGDKTDNWRRWYEKNVSVADAIYERHLAAMKEGRKR